MVTTIIMEQRSSSNLSVDQAMWKLDPWKKLEQWFDIKEGIMLTMCLQCCIAVREQRGRTVLGSKDS